MSRLGKIFLCLTAYCIAASGSAPTCGGEQFHGTAEGAPCQFPFAYAGNTYTSCTSVDHDQPWCLTDPVQYQAARQASETASWGNCNCAATASDWQFHDAEIKDSDSDGVDLKKSTNSGDWDSYAISTSLHTAISGKPGQTNKVLQFGLGDDSLQYPEYGVRLEPNGVSKAVAYDGLWVELTDYIGTYSTDDVFTVLIEDHRIILLFNGEEVHNWGSTTHRHLHAKVAFWSPTAKLLDVHFTYEEPENQPGVKGGRFCWKDTYGRGIGTIPNRCPDDKVKIGALCYSRCPEGMHRWGFDCHSICPTGWRNDGLFCARETYGRGAGYPWEFGDTAFSLSGAKKRCEDDKGKGQCEQHGLIIYPKCRSGYKNNGCCLCEPTDISCGDYDLGAKVTWIGGTSCGKRIEIGDPEPMICPEDKEKQDGLCYTPCRSGYEGVGPVCWGQPPPGWVNCGMGAAKNDYECGDAVGTQIWSVGEVALFVGTAGASAGPAKAVKAGKVAKASARWAKMRTGMKVLIAKHPRLMKAMSDGGQLAHYGLTTAAIMSEEVVTEEDAARLIAMMASLIDPTGISSVIEAYTWPKCSKLLIDYPEPLEVPNQWVPTSDAYIDATFDEFTMDQMPIGTAPELGLNLRSFTVSAWVLRHETAWVGDLSDVSILGTHRKEFSKGLHLIVRARKYYMGFYGNDCASDTYSTLDNWEHITFRYDIVEYKMAIFLNGELVKECENKFPFEGTDMVYVGDSSQDEWSGQIKNIRIFRRSLSDAEVLEAYNNEAGVGILTPPQPTLRQSVGITSWSTSDWGGLRADPTHFGKKDDFPITQGDAEAAGLTGGQWTVSAWVVRAKTLDHADYAILGTDSSSTLEGLHLVIRHNSNYDHQYHMGFIGAGCTTEPTGDFEKSKKWDWRYVTFQYNYGYMRIYENGILLKECTDKDAFRGTGLLRIGQAQQKSEFEGGIRDLKIWNVALDEIQILTEYQRMFGGIGLPYGFPGKEKGNHIANVKPSTEYELSFLIEPTGLSDDWTSIVHFTTDREDCCDAGSRMPYISMRPETTQLRILTSCGNPWNKSCNPPYDLPPNQLTEVKMRVANNMIMVWFNGHVVQECTCPTMTVPDDDWDAMVYLGDPWLDQAKGNVRSLTYTPLEGRAVVQDTVDRAHETIVEDFDESVFEMYGEDRVCASPSLAFNYGIGEKSYEGLTETECKHMLGTGVGLNGLDVVYAAYSAASGTCYTYTEYAVHSGTSHVESVTAAWELCQADEAHFELEHAGRCNAATLQAESYENSLGECADSCFANPDCDYFDYAEAYERVDLGLTSCHANYAMTLTDKHVELDVCKAACKRLDCKYIWWQSGEMRGQSTPLCSLYSSCAHFRTPTKPGLLFRQTAWTGIDLAGKTCGTNERISQGGWDHETCQNACRDNSECNFYYYQRPEDRNSNSPWCHLYRTCTSLRTPTSGGSNFAKSNWSFSDEQVEVVVGSSSTNSKTVNAHVTDCPSLVDRTNWLGQDTWPDRFSVTVSNGQVTATRLGTNGGWGMNLRIACTKNRGTNCALYSNSCPANSNFIGSHRSYKVNRDHEGEPISWHTQLAHENAHIEEAIAAEHDHLTELNQQRIDEIEAGTARRRQGVELVAPAPRGEIKLRPLQ